MSKLKDITELPLAESAEGVKLIVNDNGAAKQIAANVVGAQADWNIEDASNPAYIKNRPIIPDGFSGADAEFYISATHAGYEIEWVSGSFDALFSKIQKHKAISAVLTVFAQTGSPSMLLQYNSQEIVTPDYGSYIHILFNSAYASGITERRVTIYDDNTLEYEETWN